MGVKHTSSMACAKFLESIHSAVKERANREELPESPGKAAPECWVHTQEGAALWAWGRQERAAGGGSARLSKEWTQDV